MDILGLNFSLDSAAAIVRDGRVLAAAQEERFSRIKHDPGFPDQALRFCLAQAETTLDDLDAIAFFWNPGIHAEAGVRRFAALPRHHLEFLHNLPANLLGNSDLGEVEAMDQVIHLKSGKKLVVHYVTHHLCHAAAAFFTSPFDEAAILTVDGYGERNSTMIARGRGARIEPLLTVDFPHSIGALYAAFTQYLGFRPNSGEGKVMGLASYGKSNGYEEQIRSLVRPTEQGFELDLSPFEFFHDRPQRYNNRFVDLFGPPRLPESAVDQRHMDIAYGVQLVTEELLLHLADLARKKTGLAKLCLAGGVGLNCVANGRLIRESGIDEFFFYPAAGDAGTSVGAALWVWHMLHNGGRTGSVADEYLGPSYGRGQVAGELETAGIAYQEPASPAESAAQMIARGQIVGWFSGRSEFGPRALGNRSILADPGRADIKDVLNARVKFREPFRPYAPSVLAESCGEFFSSGVPSPYMLRTYHTLPDKTDVLPGITHLDGTARVQTVTQAQNSAYYELIRALGQQTGVPVVLNTSFNIRGEPIVNTVKDALKCLFTTDLDALFIEGLLVTKR